MLLKLKSNNIELNANLSQQNKDFNVYVVLEWLDSCYVVFHATYLVLLQLLNHLNGDSLVEQKNICMRKFNQLYMN